MFTAADFSHLKFLEGRWEGTGPDVVSTWGEYSWNASDLSPGKACFVPVNAPSWFCWEQLSEASAQVTQRWTDEDGKARQYIVPLRRL